MNGLAEVNWTAVAAIGSLVPLFGAIWWVNAVLMRRSLAADFVTSEGFDNKFNTAHAAAVKPLLIRMDEIEVRQSASPSQSDVVDLDRRIETVEGQIRDVQQTASDTKVGVAEVRTAQQGQTEMIKGMAKQIGMITTHLLGEGR